MDWDDKDTLFQVVVNHEEQYSLLPADRAAPPGWKPTGKQGNKQDCLDYIEEVWTDMRPLSLRNKQKLEAQARKRFEQG